MNSITFECFNAEELQIKLEHFYSKMGKEARQKEVLCVLVFNEDNKDPSSHYERIESRNEAIRRWNRLVNGTATMEDIR